MQYGNSKITSEQEGGNPFACNSAQAAIHKKIYPALVLFKASTFNRIFMNRLEQIQKTIAELNLLVALAEIDLQAAKQEFLKNPTAENNRIKAAMYDVWLHLKKAVEALQKVVNENCILPQENGSKNCTKSCSPSDFYKGGKCDKNGCF